MAAPTTAARVKKALASPEPSTHGPRLKVWHVCFHGECRRVSGRGLDAKETTRLTDAVEKVDFLVAVSERLIDGWVLWLGAGCAGRRLTQGLPTVAAGGL